MTREALKLALEALGANHLLIHGSETKGGLAYCMDGYYSGCFDIDSNDKQTNEAINAIKEALAQPEQEPVCDKDPQGCWNVRCQLGKKCKNTPPKHTWVGLTELEKAEITSLKWWDWEDTFDIDGFIKAIEAKLKEKNT